MEHNALPEQTCNNCRDGLLCLLRQLQSIGPKPGYLKSCKGPDRIHVDDYPGLAGLQESAAAGCDLCRLVRAAALSNEAANVFNDQTVNIQDTHTVRIQMGLNLQGIEAEKSIRDTLPDTESNDWITSARLAFLLAIGEQSNLTSGLRQGVYTPDNETYMTFAMARCWISFPLTSGPHSGARAETVGHFYPSQQLPPPLSPYALDQGPVNLMKSAIQRCTLSCGHSHDNNETFVPSRLVDVRGDILRIVRNPEIRSDCHRDLRYLALSYCWGSMSQLTFNASTQAWLSSGFSLDDLTPVQADTVFVAKALSVPYIWIDALCIRQGDNDDWDHESALMDKVYSNSFVTICAVSSTNCQEGYLHRDGTRIPIGIFGLENRDETVSSWFIQALPIISHGIPYRPLTHELASSSWLRRAWTYQENALSTRCMFFCHSGVHFRCSNFECSEYFGIVSESRFKGPSPLSTRVLLRDDFANPADEESVHLAWAQVIYDYSRRKITHAADLFPALSGLAKEFSLQFGSQQYVAGLWRKELFKRLMWRVEAKEIKSADANLSFESLLKGLCGQQYIGPSWSWVGREQAIQPCARGTSGDVVDNGESAIAFPAYKNMESSVTPLTKNTFGRISTARLILETSVYPLANGIHLPDVQPSIDSYELRNGLSVYLGGKDGPWCQLEVDWNIAGDKEVLHSLTLALLGTSTPSEKGWYCLRQYKESRLREVKSPFGLILYPAPDHGEYLRVGVFSVPTEALDDEFSHWKFFENCEVLSIQVV